MKFIKCEKCDTIVALINGNDFSISCCQEPMKELIPSTTDASKEKHIPIIKRENNVVTVEVGSVIHPMSEKHYIMWIALETKNASYRKILHPNDVPISTFYITENDEIVCAYAYCNLHSLWKSI